MHSSKLKKGVDQAWPEAIHFDLGLGPVGRAETLWRCEASCGGRVYSSGLFGSLDEAQHFATELQKAAPDHTFNVEQIKASQTWN